MHGDLDVSEIDELPPGRKPIKTELFRPSQKKEVFKRVHEEMAKGRQAYIVFPLIDESETLSAKAATVEFEKLRTGEFKDFKIGLMHGKLKSQEKDEVMDAFRRGEYHILVSTTVIEVGVDVPNSTVMVIEKRRPFRPGAASPIARSCRSWRRTILLLPCFGIKIGSNQRTFGNSYSNKRWLRCRRKRSGNSRTW